MRKSFFFLALAVFLPLIGSPQSDITTLPKTKQAADSFEPVAELRQLGSSGILLDLPEGGITQLGQPESVTTFVNHTADSTLKVEVAGANNYDYWKKGYTAGKSYKPAAYKTETLPRNDNYIFYTVSSSEKYGYPKPDGAWKEFYLVFRSNELAARVVIELPASSLGKDGISMKEIEQIFTSARLTTAGVDREGLMDPRIKLDLPASFVSSVLPTLTFRFMHERKPLQITVKLSDRKAYNEWENWIKHSAKVWKRGKLPRTDEYFYYFVLGSDPEFELAFLAAGETVEVRLEAPKSSFNKGDIKIEEIERILASARIAPAAEKSRN